jgi:hypothetical protein
MIIVNDKYALRSDGTSWSACERLKRPIDAKDGKGGEEYYRAVGYGSTVTECLKCLAKRMMREVGMGEERLTLSEAIDKMKRIQDEIYDMIEGKTGGV